MQKKIQHKKYHSHESIPPSPQKDKMYYLIQHVEHSKTKKEKVG